MSLASLPEELRLADATRDDDPAAALERYRGFAPALLAEDPERVVWILEQVRRTQDEAFLPLMRLAREADPSDASRALARRWALHLFATRAWYVLDVESAERDWREAVDAGREVRDVLWGGCIQNLAMVMAHTGQSFEGLVLTRLALEHAEESGHAYSLAHGAARLGHAYALLGETELALESLDRAERSAWDLEDEEERDAALLVITGARAGLLRERGDAAGAAREYARQLDHLRCMPDSYASVSAGARCGELRMRYELEGEPERRTALLRELEGVREEFQHTGALEDAWLNEVLPLRARHALEVQQDLATARSLARENLKFVARFHRGENLVKVASLLAREFTEPLQAPEEAQAAYELAANAALGLLLRANRSARAVPELLDATRADLELLENYRGRLVSQHTALIAEIRRLWAEDHPARLLLQEEEGPLRTCAWCSRVCSLEGNWIPATHFLPGDGEFEVSHGICPPCADELCPAAEDRG